VKRLLKRSGRGLRKQHPDFKRAIALQQKASDLLNKIIEEEKRKRTLHTDSGNAVGSKIQNPNITFSLEKISDRELIVAPSELN